MIQSDRCLKCEDVLEEVGDMFECLSCGWVLPLSMRIRGYIDADLLEEVE